MAEPERRAAKRKTLYVGAQAQLSHSITGYRLTDRDATAIIVVSTNAIAVSRLAPYPGWDEFSRGAGEVFRIVRHTVGYNILSRIGVRFINRLDIPIPGGEGEAVPLDLEAYILIFPEFPEASLPRLQGFTMQCVTLLPDIQSLATISVATFPPAVPHHRSIILDIDIGREANLPQREDQISGLLDQIRVEKNRIFMSCVTEKMRELFQ